MKAYLPFLLMPLVALLQSSFVSQLSMLNIKPDTLLIALTCWGMLAGTRQAVLWAFLGGSVLDILSGAPLGVSALALTPLAAFSLAAELKLLESGVILAAVACFIGTFAYYAVFEFVLLSVREQPGWPPDLLATIFPAATINMVLTPLFFWLVKYISGRMAPSYQVPG